TVAGSIPRGWTPCRASAAASGCSRSVSGWSRSAAGSLSGAVPRAARCSRSRCPTPAEIEAIPRVLGVRVEFVLFAATLAGVVVFNTRALLVALCGLAAVTLYELTVTAFPEGSGIAGLLAHLRHEW